MSPLTGEEATELVLQNSADGEAEGIELELTWLPTDRMTVNANLGFLDTAFPSPRTLWFHNARLTFEPTQSNYQITLWAY